MTTGEDPGAGIWKANGVSSAWLQGHLGASFRLFHTLVTKPFLPHFCWNYWTLTMSPPPASRFTKVLAFLVPGKITLLTYWWVSKSLSHSREGKGSWCAIHWVRHCIYIIILIYYQFYRWGMQDSEKSNNLPEVTSQLVRVEQHWCSTPVLKISPLWHTLTWPSLVSPGSTFGTQRAYRLVWGRKQTKIYY